MTDLDRLASDVSRLRLWWRVKEAYVRHRREMQLPFDNWLSNGHHAATVSFTVIDPKWEMRMSVALQILVDYNVDIVEFIMRT